MKHNWKIIALLLVMFLVTQFIGMYVVGYYAQEGHDLPFGMETPKIEKESDYYGNFIQIIFALVVAVGLLFLLNKFDMAFVLKLWFFTVIVIALGISLNSVLGRLGYSIFVAIAIALPLAFIKIYRRGVIAHNATELLIYPGIAAVFVPILNVWTIILLLILISIYDMWAVWKSGIMQKMAKYQINKLNIFGGFFIPYLSNKDRLKFQHHGRTQKNLIQRFLLRAKMKKSLKKKKVKVNIAILGGGDIAFPLLFSGAVLKTMLLTNTFFMAFAKTLIIPIFVTIALLFLFIKGRQDRFYPALPFLTAGCLVGYAVLHLVNILI